MISDLTSSINNIEKRNDLLFYLCLAGIIVLAILFRSQGYFDGNISFWWDEAYWGDKLITKPLKEVIRIRPVGFMFLTKLLINISKDETVFRLVSYLSSILSIPLIFLISKRIWRSKLVILLMLFIVAFNPILITFAKEFKPYALDFFIHTSFIYLSLQYIHLKKDYILYAIITLSVFSIFFCYNIVFIYPGIFLILLFDAFADRNHRKLALIIATILFIFVQLYLMYYFIFSENSVASQESYWGKKYDVFFLGSSLIEQFKWFVSKYVDLVKHSGKAEVFWPGTSQFKPVIGILLIIFHFVGIFGFVLEKKYKYLLLFLLPIVTVMLINFLGVWPFGPFRVNLFLFIYYLIFTVNGVDFFINKENKILRYCVLCIVVIFFFMLQLPINFHYYNIKPRGTWAGQSDVRKVLETIIQYEKARHSSENENYELITVTIDEHAFFSTLFYLNHHPDSVGYNKSLRQLNVKYNFRLSGIETVNNMGVESVNNKTILGILRKLLRNSKVSRREAWLVIGKPDAIDQIELIIDKMPERIIYRNKLSYASLVVLLRI